MNNRKGLEMAGSDKLGWGDLHVLHAVAKTGSLSQAAALLGTSHPTVFRRIQAIEQTLGATLFERSRQGYRATAAAAELLELAEHIAQRLNDISGSASADGCVGGRVLLSTTETMLPTVLPPVLAKLRQSVPGILVELDIADGLANLQRREADVALRAGGQPPDELVGRIVCGIETTVYRPAAWAPVDEARLAAVPWVCLDDGFAHLASMQWLKERGLLARAAARCNSTVAVMRLAEQGMGLAMLPCYLGDACGALRRVLPPQPQFRSDLWLLSHASTRGVARIGAVLDGLSEGLRQQADLFEGRRPWPAP
ncbi:LysR family transcriptional regulator [Massilia sp. Root418]|uniref:LysR family transcriptional regulator n=1 Tax=Massilia sp. Root418 TaxID=1736532 RepID=UPI0012F6E107|nr:LysR family transcriptional regulator [Massilia sp. Root418]